MKKINNKGFGLVSLFAYLMIFFAALFIVVVIVNKISTPITPNNGVEEEAEENIGTSLEQVQ